jgi:hypothetical protein
MQARHEYKHHINHADYLLVRSRLRALIAHDSHVDASGCYRVCSLYFDTPADKALREKLDGVDRREKFRLRRYDDETDYIRLEKKSKVKGLCYKEKAAVTADEVRRLLAGDLAWMKGEDRPLVVELYAKIKREGLAPKVIVNYEREPFTYAPGNVRVTLDRDIRTGRYAKDFLASDVPLMPAGDVDVLLEVKYDAFIPDFITNLVRLPNRRATAFSKYAVSRIFG